MKTRVRFMAIMEFHRESSGRRYLAELKKSGPTLKIASTEEVPPAYAGMGYAVMIRGSYTAINAAASSVERALVAPFAARSKGGKLTHEYRYRQADLRTWEPVEVSIANR